MEDQRHIPERTWHEKLLAARRNTSPHRTTVLTQSRYDVRKCLQDRI